MNRKSLAILLVLLAASVCIVPFSEESDATSDIYRIELTISGETFSNISVSGVSTVTPVSSSSDGSWGFDPVTGRGPFNSYYAAISSVTGELTAILDPEDLSQDLQGNPVDITSGSNNVFWILPTIYWTVDDGKLIITNDPNAGCTAYAHTIDGHVYDYIGIAVFEGSVSNGKLLSVSGASPTVNITRTAARTAALSNGDSSDSLDYMLWNYFQWTAYKVCSFAVMGSTDSQSVIGLGYTQASGNGTTGSTVSSGPYYGTSTATDHSKLFIEDSWGGVWEFIDDVAFSERRIYAGQNLDASWCDSAYSSAWDTASLVKGTVALPSSNYIVSTSDSASTFDLPIISGSSGYDHVWSNTGSRMGIVGGDWNDGSQAGVSAFSGDYTLSTSHSHFGARLACAFDAGAASEPALAFASAAPSGSYIVGSSISWPVSLNIEGCTVSLSGAPDWLAYSTQLHSVVGSVPASYSDVTPIGFYIVVTSPGGQIVQQQVSVSVEPVLAFTSAPTAACVVIPVVSYHADGSVDASIIDDFRSGMISERTGDTFRYVFIGTDAEIVEWDFGDGSTAIGNSVLHRYASSGTYEIVCTASNSVDGGSSDSCTVEVTVDPDYSDLFYFGSILVLVILACILLVRIRLGRRRA